MSMTQTELTAHLREYLRGDGPQHHLLEVHGVTDAPVKRAEAAALHAKLHAEEVPSQSASAEKAAKLLAGVTRKPETETDTVKPARKPKAPATAPKATAPKAPATPREPKASPTKAAAAANRVRSGRKLAVVPDATETAPKPAPRTRKPKATPEPVKPAPARTRGRKPAAAAPAPKADANGSGELSRSARKRALAREVVTLVTERFMDLSDAERADIAYWLHWCPTGDLWWPSNGFPEPVTDGWLRGKARLAERDGK
jgi:hypothetical protein